MSWRMTASQGSTVLDLYRTKGVETGFVGLDAEDRPVIWVRDAVRQFQMAIRSDGAGRDPVLPLRDFTEEEVVEMPERDSRIIFSLPIKPPTQEVWHDPRRSVPIDG